MVKTDATTSQTPKPAAVKDCPFCGGKGRVKKTGKLKNQTQRCLHCRGTGHASSGYLTK